MKTVAVRDISVYCVVLKISEVENPETDVALGIKQTAKRPINLNWKRRKCLWR